MSRAGVLFFRHVFESGDRKRIAKQPSDVSDLHIIRDIPYLNDDEQGHLLDIYSLKDAPEDAPVMINIHGGGLFASYKEVNCNFNYQMARTGLKVVSISYRRIPETTMIHQLEDVMNAFAFIREHGREYQLNLDRLYISGDSAGALLTLYSVMINSSPKLQEIFGLPGTDLDFKAAAFISIMSQTQRKDVFRVINDRIARGEENSRPYAKYLKDFRWLFTAATLPPSILFTSEEDLIRNDTLLFRDVLQDNHVSFDFHDYPKGTERELVHVFTVLQPFYPESMDVQQKIHDYFLKQEADHA